MSHQNNASGGVDDSQDKDTAGEMLKNVSFVEGFGRLSFVSFTLLVNIDGK